MSFAATTTELIAVRRILWEVPVVTRSALAVRVRENGSIPDPRRLAMTLDALAAAAEIELVGEEVRTLQLDLQRHGHGRPRRSSRRLLGLIRSLLRTETVMEREALRERLRAAGQIGEDGFGGRRVFHLLHYLRRRGEIMCTPTHVHAIDVMPVPMRKRKPVRRASGPRVDRWKAAAKRARRRARLASC